MFSPHQDVNQDGIILFFWRIIWSLTEVVKKRACRDLIMNVTAEGALKTIICGEVMASGVLKDSKSAIKDSLVFLFLI